MTIRMGMGIIPKDKKFYRAGRATQEWKEREILAAMIGTAAGSIVLMQREPGCEPLGCDFRPAYCNRMFIDGSRPNASLCWRVKGYSGRGDS